MQNLSAARRIYLGSRNHIAYMHKWYICIYIYIYIYIYICIYTCVYIFKLFMLKIKMISRTIFRLHMLLYSLLLSTRIFHYHKERTWIGLSYIKSALNWWTWLIKLFPPTFLTISILPHPSIILTLPSIY